MIAMPIVTEKGLMRYLRTKREERGLTQRDVGDALGYDSQTICLYETGRRHMKIDTLLRYLEELGLVMDITIR